MYSGGGGGYCKADSAGGLAMVLQSADSLSGPRLQKQAGLIDLLARNDE